MDIRQQAIKEYLVDGMTYHQLSIFIQQQYRAEVTQNISTAESP